LLRSVSIKTAMNAMGSLRAMMREASPNTYGMLFAALKWPRRDPPEPDPFSETERDRIIAWFGEKQPFYRAFVYTLFHTGMRPSEATGLRWGDVDTDTGSIHVRRSRYMGQEGPPKTRKSRRTIRLLPGVRDVLRDLKPLRAEAESYVFVNREHGGPIHQGEWAREFWWRPRRASNIRPRKFYATRHTFISHAVTAGVNLKWLAEYCGNPVEMIERHYGRFMPSGEEAQLRLLMGENQGAETGKRLAARGGENCNRCSRSAENVP
jgi:integrase